MTDAADSLAKRYGAAVPPPGAWNETLDLLLAHRSVRHYTSDPLPYGALEAALAAAQSASTSSNLQLWSVIAVEDEGRKQRLSVRAANQAHVANAPLLLVWLADLARLRALGDSLGVATEGLDYFRGFPAGDGGCGAGGAERHDGFRVAGAWRLLYRRLAQPGRQAWPPNSACRR